MEEEHDNKKASPPPPPIYPVASRGPLGIPNSEYLKRGKARGKRKDFNFKSLIFIAVLIALSVFWVLGGASLLDY